MKKIILLFLLMFLGISLTSCGTHDEVIANRNYKEYINISYTVNVIGPKYGDMGYDYYFNVTITPLDSKYTFENVVIRFNQEPGGVFKLPSNGHATYTLTSYHSTNTVQQEVKITSITGHVKWKEN